MNMSEPGKRQRAKEAEDLTPRPPCSACGEPATTEVSVVSRRLRLERDAGVQSRPYWRPSFHNETDMKTIMCDACVRKNVSIDFTASATMSTKGRV